MRWTGWVLMAAVIATAGSAAGYQPGCASCNGGTTVGPWDAEPCAGPPTLLPGTRLLRRPPPLLRQRLGRLLRPPGEGRRVLGQRRRARQMYLPTALPAGADGFLLLLCVVSDPSHAADAGDSFPEPYAGGVPNS